jgi:putative chitinase
MTVDQLIHLGVKQSTAHKYLSFLNAATIRYAITTPLRLAHFHAQCLHESGMLVYTQEIASGEAYEGRKDLGNILPGDGKLFKGRGFIQITGRTTYIEYGNTIGENITASPQIVSEAKYAADSAGWFWSVFKKDSKGRNLNMMADEDNFLRITYFVNGGFNGLIDRFTILKKAYTEFGVDDIEGRLQRIVSHVADNIFNEDRAGMDKTLLKYFPDSKAVNKLAEAMNN